MIDFVQFDCFLWHFHFDWISKILFFSSLFFCDRSVLPMVRSQWCEHTRKFARSLVRSRGIVVGLEQNVKKEWNRYRPDNLLLCAPFYLFWPFQRLANTSANLMRSSQRSILLSALLECPCSKVEKLFSDFLTLHLVFVSCWEFSLKIYSQV